MMIKNNNIMKTYKLTPLEQLKLEQKQLREEIKMAFQLQYISDNWGSMLLKSATSSVMNKVTDRIESSSPVSKTSSLTRTLGVGGGLGGLLLSNYKTVGSLGWRLLKPIALTFLTKKATSLLFPKKKRR